LTAWTTRKWTALCKRSHGGKPVVIRRNLDLRPVAAGEPADRSSTRS